MIKVYSHYFIFEDDAEPMKYVDDFYKIFDKALIEMPKDYDICLLGYITYKPKKTNVVYDNLESVESFYGLHGYLISKKGAINFLKKVYPIEVQIDTYIE